MKTVKLLLFILSFLFIFITGITFVNAEEGSGSVTVTVERDGGWSSRGSWSASSNSCDGGAQFQTRSCTNPEPAKWRSGLCRCNFSVSSM